MTHRRLTIRNLIVDRLKGSTRARENVYPGRTLPLQEEDLPALVVHTRAERSNTYADDSPDFPASGWGGPQQRRLTIEIEACSLSFQVVDNQALDDYGDAYAAGDILAAQVETRLGCWTIPGFESAFLLIKSSESEITADTGIPVVTVRLIYEMIYTTIYRDSSEPYVIAGDSDILRSGAYPGGRVLPGCPPAHTGTECPIEEAELWLDGRRIWGP